MSSSAGAPDISSLLQRLERLESVHEIEQVMSRRAYLHSAGRHDRELDELWSTAEDITFEAEDWGAWTSRESIRASYVSGNPFPSGTPGLLIEHTLSNPVIEIAGDGQTAKGVWVSPGHETFPMKGQPRPHWSWGRYAVDFRREIDEPSRTLKWKIWHLHVITTFRTPYGTDWVASSTERPDYLPKEGEVMESVKGPDRGVSWNEPYRPDRAPKYQPVPPEPYQEWKDTWSATDFYEHPAEKKNSLLQET